MNRSLMREQSGSSVAAHSLGNGRLWVVFVAFGILPVLCARAGLAQTLPATRATTMPAPPEHIKEDGESPYEVSGFDIRYDAPARKGLPPIQEVLQLPLQLGEVRDGYVAPRDRVPLVVTTLADAAKRAKRAYYPSAIKAINTEILNYFNEKKKLIGIYVSVDKNDIVPAWDPDERERGRDRRGADKTLHLVIVVGRVGELRTVASGERIPSTQRINSPAHRRIVENSPIQPGLAGQEVSNDLLRKDFLDDYVFRLNRRPSRHVDAAISASEKEGAVALDYLISEPKPWTVYSQVSNTGTAQTSEWRERFGLTVNDLTRAEDNLSIDYTTANFEEKSQALLASYEAMLLGIQRLRWRAYGSWSDFVASDVGQSQEQFSGEETVAGGELILNFFQHHELFGDLVGGVQYKSIRVGNETLDVRGDGEFVVPYIGLRFERRTERASTDAGLSLSFGRHTVTHTTTTTNGMQDTPDGLGRLNADRDWRVLQGNLTQSLFLEPLFCRNYTTLAHELVLSARGQFTDEKLIPQEEEVAGGFYTVRGYPESVVAGDKVFIGSAEYRYHIPRSFKRSDPSKLFGKPFRWAPEQPYGRPDWDLILRTFVDVAHTSQNQRQSFESDDWLAGAGVGVELQIKQNISLRLDWGIALKDLEDSSESIRAGHNRLHVLLTFAY